MGAPLSTLQALVKACIEQVGVIHRRGSVLTEALRHRASNEVVDFLLKAIIHYQATSHCRINVLGSQDDWGRTALHYMVERVKTSWERGEANAYNWCLFRDLLHARPESIQTLDTDGNTPLILLLLLPRAPTPELYATVEAGILQMVQLMVSLCPCVAAITRRLPEPWHSNAKQETSPHASRPTIPDGSPTPLHYAILHGRSLETVNALLEANRKVGINACATIISQYHEVPLHTAISTQAPLSILSRLVQECPESVLCADGNGLTPIDWIWIRHVVDWHTENNTPRTLVSRGRFLAGSFMEWHESVSQALSGAEDDGNDDENDRMESTPLAAKAVTRDLIARMELLLPMAAVYAAPDHVGKSWSLLHMTCYVPCPLAMVHLALNCTNEDALQSPDYQQRLPLHWAAARFGYTANFPVGVSRAKKRLVERTPVPTIVSKYEPACRVVDGHGQLPLHIAIDAARYYRKVAMVSQSPRLTKEEVNEMEDEVLETLLSSCPDSLECVDGKSGLLPFQQAAIGSGARLDTVYTLLRLLPTLLSAQDDMEVD
jgi:hypothetical protein